ncbi:xyloside xylosyltransferase 1 [Cephus cinctus]|uniref:Xyloside xylosyltransferase 1 n=1 Tax=Cephus cinctus TaxID=211228 RepID=A0AAJ7BQZ1_CEPCN|nr:xyloside xylosyltransferase 1 [Cephus cinctus]
MYLLRKILLKLTFCAVFFVLLYSFQASTSVYWNTYNFGGQNVSEKMEFPSAVAVAKYSNDIASSSYVDSTVTPKKIEYYNVWCIFTKVTSNSPIRRKFKIFSETLLRLATVDIAFHVITDSDSKGIAENEIQGIMRMTGKLMKVQYYDVHKLASQLENIVSVMSPHFSSKPGTYYSDALFFLSLGLHRIAPMDQNLAVMFDVDTKLRRDIKELFQEFNHFGEKALFGLAPELTPVYRHVLYLYRSKNPKTIFGEPLYSGGYSGYNSGVILINLERLRNSLEYDQIVSQDSVDHLAEKFNFKGHLGDQDFYTILGMERPEFIYTLDCGWNRQLCTWWRDRGYTDVFSSYAQCDSETKLWHGNCNAPIPDD